LDGFGAAADAQVRPGTNHVGSPTGTGGAAASRAGMNSPRYYMASAEAGCIVASALKPDSCGTARSRRPRGQPGV